MILSLQGCMKVKDFPCTVMDFGAEEIELFTLNYPKSMGLDW